MENFRCTTCGFMFDQPASIWIEDYKTGKKTEVEKCPKCGFFKFVQVEKVNVSSIKEIKQAEAKIYQKFSEYKFRELIKRFSPQDQQKCLEIIKEMVLQL